MRTPRISFVTSSGVEDSIVSVLRDNGLAVSIEIAPVSLEKLVRSQPDLLVLDISDPIEANDLIKNIRSSSELKETLLIALAEWGSGVPTLALSNGVDAFEPKPIDGGRLAEAVERLLTPKPAMTANAGPGNEQD